MLDNSHPTTLMPGETLAANPSHTSELEWSLTISGHGLLSLCERWRQAHETNISSDWLQLAMQLDGAAMFHITAGVINELLLLVSVAEAHADAASL